VVIAISAGAALLLSLGSPFFLKPVLQRLGVIDVPNGRSSHTRPVIRGAGLGPLIAMIVAFVILLLNSEPGSGSIILVVVALVAVAAAVLGWIEDLRGVPVKLRAASQLTIGLMGAGVLVALAGAPWWLVPVFGLGIAGYINVANFMDGINGISGLHGAVVGGVFALTGALTDVVWLIPAGLLIAASFLGFLPWNLRGGVFLGDVGSYLLGGSVGMVAVAALVSGVPLLAVLGPLSIYLVDSGTTLVSRVLSGERWYEAHRSHTYQRLTDLGFSHVRVALIISVASLASSLAGLLSLVSTNLWLVSAVLIVLIAVVYLFLGTILRSSRRTVEPNCEGVVE